MASATVSTKMSPEEFSLVIEAVEHLRDSKHATAKDETVEAKLRHEARGVAVQADNLLRNLRS